MSIRVMTLVWDGSTHKGSELLCLLAIADFADDAGVAYPSIPKLAEKTRMSQRNVISLLKALEESGELSIDRDRGRGRHNLYRVNVQRLHVFTQEKREAERTKKVKDRAENVKHSAENLNGASPDPSEEPSKDPSGEPSGETAPAARSGPKPQWSEDARILATDLYDRLKARDALPADKRFWVRQAAIAQNDLLTDGRTLEQLQAGLAWAFAHPFWGRRTTDLGTFGRRVWPEYVQATAGGSGEENARRNHAAARPSGRPRDRFIRYSGGTGTTDGMAG